MHPVPLAKTRVLPTGAVAYSYAVLAGVDRTVARSPKSFGDASQSYVVDSAFNYVVFNKPSSLLAFVFM